ncbi:hypothetical protein [Pseudomonas sp. MPC6]|uniref:hypothetical protein n=1 Tax=unclassified Pseudomonas TaxID=196821 RepID=UPI0011104EDD|nr:hypothetical protein [Pseudomonas sp. MPC6]QCY09793.1 hypothetical protein ELQ88_02780 [Pseudomonas sp. MPC6]
MGDVVQRPAELIAQLPAVAAARVKFAHDLLSSCVFTDAFAGKPVSLPSPVRRPVAHPVNAFIRESWVKACAIRIASLPATDRLANASVLSLAQPFNNNNGDPDVFCYSPLRRHSTRTSRASRSALTPTGSPIP